MDPVQTVYLKDYVAPAFLIDEVILVFELDESLTVVTAKLHLRANPLAQNRSGDLVLMGEQLETLSVHLNGEPLPPKAYAITDTLLTIFSSFLGSESFVLETKVKIRPAENTALSGLYLSNGNYCTQCEPEGFRRITWFLDRPDVMAKYTVTVTADASRYPVLLSNGNPAGSGSADHGKHWAKWEDPFKKPSYLFALVAGDFDCLNDEFVTASGRTVALRIYTDKGQGKKTAFAMQSLKKAMRWDEEKYGREYDLDIFMIVAVSDFNMGAMENKGLNIFNTRYVLVSPDTATDPDYIQTESVIAHEYFHNWTGNRVTCRDWFQLSLKEGLTVFRDQSFTADSISPAVARIDDVDDLRNSQFVEDAGPLAHPVQPDSYMEINNFYTATVYNKGAEVIRMIRTLLGVQNFRRGMDLYFARHDGQAVTIDDFIRAHEDATGVDLTQFRRWYSVAGTPVLLVTDQYDSALQTWRVTIRQHCPDTPGQSADSKKPFQIPLMLGLLDESGREIENTLIVLKDSVHERVWKNMPHRPVLSLLRDFSAPVKVQYECSDAALAMLFMHDTDAFSRREAGFQLAVRCILRFPHTGGKKVPSEFLQTFQKVMETGKDPWFLAKMLELPSEKYLAGQMKEIDVLGIHESRQHVRHEIARFCESFFSEKWHLLSKTGREPGFSVLAAGERALKNTCLAYLASLSDHEIHENMVMKQFRAALGRNMTDTMAALSAINNIAGDLRFDALSAFFDMWQHDALVTDKWFALQAASNLPGTLAEIKKLLSHPLFDLKNPNRVYALLGTFGNNQVIFHAADGAGYTLLAEYVLQLDRLNPQVAARMVKPLTALQGHTPARQNQMAAALATIADCRHLSPDLNELVTKSLCAGVYV